MVESPAILNDASTVFGKFVLDFGVLFCVAGAELARLEGDACCSAHCK